MSSARRTRSARSRIPSFFMSRARYDSTVLTLSPISSAICWLVYPLATWRRTSRSRSLSESTGLRPEEEPGESIESIEVARAAGHTDLKLLGILATRVRPRFAEHRYRLRELNEAFGDVVLPPIPDRTAIQQAQGSCVPVQRWRSQSAKAASAAFDELLDLALAQGTTAPSEKR